jgi:hypothetical protein
LACHLQIDPDPVPDPAYHFDADPDPDFYLMLIRIQINKMMRIRMRIRIRNTGARDSAVVHYRSSEPDPWSRGRLDPGEAGGGGRGANQAQQPEEGPFEQVRTFSGDLIFTQTVISADR